MVIKHEALVKKLSWIPREQNVVIWLDSEMKKKFFSLNFFYSFISSIFICTCVVFVRIDHTIVSLLNTFPFLNQISSSIGVKIFLLNFNFTKFLISLHLTLINKKKRVRETTNTCSTQKLKNWKMRKNLKVTKVEKFEKIGKS